jgi:hypothetical protein
VFSFPFVPVTIEHLRRGHVPLLSDEQEEKRLNLVHGWPGHYMVLAENGLFLHSDPWVLEVALMTP